ncbi:MAG TPA: exodeoxyribonuclease III [Candidatus Megaira endosymbiont of Nemacystus decipiens]|nr:exodeoxyribonuclease III [Candidatus Megaera endosymbiont of Nemacystus decipiens]
MKIVTWNINSIRLRLELIKIINEKYLPDVICLQETKVEDKFFPMEAINNMGFPHVVFRGQKSYNGVAILSKYPIINSFAVDLYNEDKRHICGRIKNIEIHNFYVPAGGDIPDESINPKFKHKIQFVKLMQDWFKNNRNKSDKIILLGDLNIAPHENDVWSTKQLRDVVSHTPIERSTLINFQKSFDFIDTGRHFIPQKEKLYSWWSYRNRDWKKSNRGRRLDHLWVSSNLAGDLIETYYDRDMRSSNRPSDHIPCLLKIRS